MAGARRHRTLRALLAVSTAACTALFGCNLIFGIDEQGPRIDPVEGGENEAGPDTTPSNRPVFEKCSTDSDCIAPNGCYTPHCDRVLGACTYALCESKGTTCSMGTCNTSTFACESPSSYGFRTTTYGVSGVTSGCGPNPDACVAAMYPFLFLGTNDTVVALRVDDLVAKSATKMSLDGVDVKPTQLVQSARRIWVVGAPQGTAPPYRLPLAAIDVPSDPFAAAIHATTAFVSYPFPTAIAFAAPNGGLFVTFNDPAQGLPTMIVDVPVVKDGVATVANAADAGIEAGPYDAGPGAPAYTMFRAANVPGGSAAVASSGSRLVTWRGGVVNIIERPGTATATAQGDQGIQPGFAPLLAPKFAQGPDGVVAVAAPLMANNPMPDCDCITVPRQQWILPNAIATNIDVNQYFHAEGYRNPPLTAACYSCSGYFTTPSLVTWIDARSLLGAAANSGDRERTAVRLLTRDPLTSPLSRRISTRQTDVPKGNFAVDRIALTSANGFGYLVMADGQGNGTTVSIFDPRCDVPDGGQ